jgi:hypothetical protein
MESSTRILLFAAASTFAGFWYSLSIIDLAIVITCSIFHKVELNETSKKILPFGLVALIISFDEDKLFPIKKKAVALIGNNEFCIDCHGS